MSGLGSLYGRFQLCLDGVLIFLHFGSLSFRCCRSGSLRLLFGSFSICLGKSSLVSLLLIPLGTLGSFLGGVGSLLLGVNDVLIGLVLLLLGILIISVLLGLGLLVFLLLVGISLRRLLLLLGLLLSSFGTVTCSLGGSLSDFLDCGLASLLGLFYLLDGLLLKLLLSGGLSNDLLLLKFSLFSVELCLILRGHGFLGHLVELLTLIVQCFFGIGLRILQLFGVLLLLVIDFLVSCGLRVKGKKPRLRHLANGVRNFHL